MGNSLQQYRLVVGMHSLYLVAKEFRGCFKGKFWCSVLLLFYLEAIYLPVLKCLVYIYEMSVMNRLWLTQIYLYRFYIPELIRLANDIETNPGPGIVDQTKTIAAHLVMLKYLVRQMQAHNVWQCLCQPLFIISEVQ